MTLMMSNIMTISLGENDRRHFRSAVTGLLKLKAYKIAACPGWAKINLGSKWEPNRICGSVAGTE
jgi:hypothetical protein